MAKALSLQPEGGRYPGAFAPVYRPGGIRARLRREGDTLLLVIDDDGNGERWERFSVDAEFLRRWLD